jgi:hypothetical protein
MHDLERDGSIVSRISGEVDGGHSAARDFALDAIAIAE